MNLPIASESAPALTPPLTEAPHTRLAVAEAIATLSPPRSTRGRDAETAQVVLLEARTIGPGPFPNRDEASYRSEEFTDLCRLILSAGGNIVPIQVIEVADPVGDIRYHVVYGERRHRACLDADLPVRAVIAASMSEAKLMEHRLIENQARADLSPLDFGRQCRFAMDRKHYPSLQALALKLGRKGAGEISKAITLANLPDIVVQAFPSHSDLGYRDSKPLTEALEANYDAVISAAQSIVQTKLEGEWTANKVREHLLKAANGAVGPSNKGSGHPIVVGDRTVGSINLDKAGITRLTIDAALDDKQMGALAAVTAKLLVRYADKFSMKSSARTDAVK